MIFQRKQLVTAFFIAATATAAQAEGKMGLSGSGEAGFTSTTGNTQTESLVAALKTEYRQKMYKAKGLLEAANKNESGTKTQERYVADIQLDRYVTDMPNTYGFLQARYENDRFENIDLNSYYFLGLGHEFFNTDITLLSLEAGLGYQNNDYSSASTTKDFDQTSGKLAVNFEYQINANVRFLQDGNVYTGGDQTKTETNTGVKVKLSDALNMKASYKYRHNSMPDAGSKKEDTETQITIVYDF